MDTSYIYLEGRHVSYLYLVWLLFLFIYDVTLISAILSETHYFTSLSNPFIHRYICNIYFQAQICRIDNVSQNPISEKGHNCLLPCSFVITIDEVDHPWYPSSHGEFLGVLRSNLSIVQST